MGSILSALAGLKIINDCIHRNSEDYQETEQDMLNSEKRLRAVLDKEGKKLMEEYEDNSSLHHFFHGRDHFQYGYQLGVLMMAEIFAEKERILKDMQSL